MSGKPDQFGVRGQVSKNTTPTKGHPPKHMSGTDNKGTKVKVHRAGK